MKTATNKMRKSERLDMKHKKWGQREIERNEEWFLTAESVRAEASTKVPEGLVLLLSVCSPLRLRPKFLMSMRRKTEGKRARNPAFLQQPSAVPPPQQKSHSGGPRFKKLKSMSNFGQSSLESTKAGAHSEHKDSQRGKCFVPVLIRRDGRLQSAP